MSASSHREAPSSVHRKSDAEVAVGTSAFTKEDVSAGSGSFIDLLHGPFELWVVFALKVLVSFSYFALFNVLTLYLTEDFRVSDSSAGWIYGAHGMIAGVFSIFGGLTADKLGVRWTLVIGSASLAFGYGLIAWTQSLYVFLAALLMLKPMGSALCMPALTISVRRYTTPATRPFAFSLFYIVMNLSAGLAVVAIGAARRSLVGGVAMPFYEGRISTWRAVASMAFVFAVAQFALSLVMRTPPDDAAPSDVVAARRAAPPWTIAYEVCKENKFLRFACLVLIFVGVRSVFRHLDATFPKYFLRTFGHKAPFEYFLAINPFCILAFTPPATALFAWLKIGYAPILITGAFLSGFAPFFLVLESSYRACVAFIVLLTLGEAIWSPKLYEYSVAIAPVGREATYAALSAAPIFFSTMLIGGFSGHLLQVHCPEEGQCDGRSMWMWIALSTVTSPILAVLGAPFIFNSRDLEEDRMAGNAAMQPSYGATGTPSRTGRSGV